MLLFLHNKFSFIQKFMKPKITLRVKKKKYFFSNWNIDIIDCITIAYHSGICENELKNNTIHHKKKSFIYIYCPNCIAIGHFNKAMSYFNSKNRGQENLTKPKEKVIFHIKIKEYHEENSF